MNQKQIRVANANSYNSSKEFPTKALKKGMAYFDSTKQTLLVPMKVNGENLFIPFHIYTIKNVAMNIEKSTAFLRVNFHTALQYGKDIVIPNLEAIKDTVFIKEITLKSETGGHNL
jgi:nucleosome binding factor SPN SPT16 subunit